MSYETERKRQLQVEIDWLKVKIKTVRKSKHHKHFCEITGDGIEDINQHYCDTHYDGTN